MTDETRGYKSGDKCPDCSKGIVTIRVTVTVTPGKGNKVNVRYACCSRCSWATYRQ